MKYFDAMKKRTSAGNSIRLMATVILIFPAIFSAAAEPMVPGTSKSGNVSIDLVSAPLSDAVKELAQQTNIPISMGSWAADRPFTILCHNTPYKRLLPAIAWAVRGKWQKLASGSIELVPDIGTLIYEQKQETDHIRWIEDRDLNRLILLQKNIQDAPPHSIVSTIWNSLSDEQQQAVLGMSLLHSTPAMIGNFSYLIDQIIGNYMFSSLSEKQKKVVTAGIEGMMSLGDIDSTTNLQGFTLGFAWTGNQLNVAGYTDAKKVWVAGSAPLLQTNDGLRMFTADGVLIASDGCNKLRNRSRADFFQPLPAGYLTPVFTIPQDAVVGPANIDHLLQFLFVKTHVPVVCDGYIASQSIAVLDFMAGKSYTLKSALTPISHYTGHHFILFDGVISGRTETLGRDILEEPPQQLVDTYTAWKNEQKPLTLSEFIALESLSSNQRQGLLERNEEISKHPGESADSWPIGLHPFLRLLTPAQWLRSQTPYGLLLKKMTLAEQRLFLLTTLLGAKIHPQLKILPSQEGFFLHSHSKNGNLQSITFIFKAIGTPSSFRMWVWNNTFPGVVNRAFPNMAAAKSASIQTLAH